MIPEWSAAVTSAKHLASEGLRTSRDVWNRVIITIWTWGRGDDIPVCVGAIDASKMIV